MKNLKKVLALGLSAAMALSMFVTGAGAAFTDQADIKATEAVDTLTALNVINGEPDGSFKPEGTVTRAQMAKMIFVVRNGGKDDATAYANLPTTFTDVNGNWAAGFIKYCQNNKIIAGKSATQFDPDGLVTGTEAAKMLLVTMGYDAEKAGLIGSAWSVNTLSLADENGLLKDVDASLDAGLPRQYAAQIIYNTLDAKRVKWSADAGTFDYVLNGGASETVGSKYMDLTTYETTLQGTGKYGSSKGKMKTGAIIKINGQTQTSPGAAKTFDYDKDLSNLMYQRIKVLTGKDSKVYGVYALDTDAVLTANTADVDKDGDKIKVDGTTYSLETAASPAVDKNVTVIENGDNKGDMTAAAFKTAYEFTGSTVTFIDSNDTGKFDTAVVSKPIVGKVTSVNASSVVAGGKTYKSSDDTIADGLVKDDYAVVTKDLYNDNNVVAKAEVVEGKYNGLKTNEVRVGDSWYKTSSAAATMMNIASSGNTVQLFVANGVAFDAKKVSGSGSGAPDMAFVITFGTTPVKQANVMFADGTTKVVNVEGANPTEGNFYEYTVKNDKYTFKALAGNSDYTVVGAGALNVYDTTSTSDTTAGHVKALGTAGSAKTEISDDAVVFLYSSDEDDAKKITGKQLKTMDIGAANGKVATSALGAYISKVNGMNRVTYVAIAMGDGNLPGSFNSNDNYGYVVNDAYRNGDYIVYKIWTGTEITEVREEATFTSTAGDATARLRGDVVGYRAIETVEGDLPEIKDVTGYSTAAAADGTSGKAQSLKVGAISGTNKNGTKVAIDAANEYDITGDSVILNVNSYASSTDDRGIAGKDLTTAPEPVSGMFTSNALYVLDGTDIAVIVVDPAGVMRNARQVAVTITGNVTVKNQNGDTLSSGDFVAKNELLEVTATNGNASGGASMTLSTTNSQFASATDGTTAISEAVAPQQTVTVTVIAKTSGAIALA